ncbi:40S ribosomal protein S15a-1 [Zea mays]|uniref:Small ribosomal subunit protein uS8c n=1 Tax=Zea mays TaxID=4577 RepID=A0A1D6QKN2_MAIZE|nr:40S ribosomal protein S15a-1 [Zea mays]
MVRVSVLNDALKSMYNAEKIGKRQVMIRPSSKVIIKFLTVMQRHGYIGEFEYVDDHRSGKIVVELNGRLNKCGVISPRFDIGVKDIEGWTARLLPSSSDTSSSQLRQASWTTRRPAGRA